LIIIVEDTDVLILLLSDLIMEVVMEDMEVGILLSDLITEDTDVLILLLSDLIMEVVTEDMEVGILLSDLITADVMEVIEAIDAMEVISLHHPSDLTTVAMDVTHGKTMKTTVAVTRKMIDLLQNSDQNPMRAKALLIPPLTLPLILKEN